MDINKISIGVRPPHDVNVIIEIPQGGYPVKYEMDKASGAMFVDRFLHTSMIYPGNYGFIPHTLSADGDPCDVLVVGQMPVISGAVIRSRPIGALLMEEKNLASAYRRLRTAGFSSGNSIQVLKRYAAEAERLEEMEEPEGAE